MATTTDKKITDPEVIELIRDAMPEATFLAKGLLDSNDRSFFPLTSARSGRYKSIRFCSVGMYNNAVMIISEAAGTGKMGGFGILFVGNNPDNNSFSFEYISLGSNHSASENGYLATPLYYYIEGNVCHLYAKHVQELGNRWFNSFVLSGNMQTSYAEMDIPSGAIEIPQKRFQYT